MLRRHSKQKKVENQLYYSYVHQLQLLQLHSQTYTDPCMYKIISTPTVEWVRKQSSLQMPTLAIQLATFEVTKLVFFCELLSLFHIFVPQYSLFEALVSRPAFLAVPEAASSMVALESHSDSHHTHFLSAGNTIESVPSTRKEALCSPTQSTSVSSKHVQHTYPLFSPSLPLSLLPSLSLSPPHIHTQ